MVSPVARRGVEQLPAVLGAHHFLGTLRVVVLSCDNLLFSVMLERLLMRVRNMTNRIMAHDQV